MEGRGSRLRFSICSGQEIINLLDIYDKLATHRLPDYDKDMIYTPFSGAVDRTSRARAGLYVDAWLYRSMRPESWRCIMRCFRSFFAAKYAFEVPESD